MYMHVATVLQVEKAPLESYADVGGLEQQVQEIKEAVELPLTNPELYEDIGIKPPKVSDNDDFGVCGV
jgi:26S proteasome regulatory subunit T2